MREEILIRAFVAGKSREFLTAHPEWRGTGAEEAKIGELLRRREAGEPLAYILGFKEFYGRKFKVTPEVLIPRPETESLVDIIKELEPTSVLDVGTGSGCIAITVALELPETEVVGGDISAGALGVARENAERLGARVEFLRVDEEFEWILNGGILKQVQDDDNDSLIVANLPYVDRDWEWLDMRSLGYEPTEALFAGDGGLALIKELVKTVAQGEDIKYLLLELDPSQREEALTFAKQYGFTEKKTGVKSEFALLLENNLGIK